MTLLDVKIEEKYVVKDIKCEENVTRRLEALGINELTEIKVLNKKKSGVVIIMVRGTRIALGKEIAGGIELDEKRD